MAGQIPARMQDIHDDGLLGQIQKDEEMLPRPDEAQVFGIVDKDPATPAMGLTGSRHSG